MALGEEIMALGQENLSRLFFSFPVVFCVALGEEDLRGVQGKKLLAKIVTLGEASVSGSDICFTMSFTISFDERRPGRYRE
jgi:hypothetical protein